MGQRGARVLARWRGDCEIPVGGMGTATSIASWLGDAVVHPKGKTVVAGWGGGISSGLLGRNTASPGGCEAKAGSSQPPCWAGRCLASPARPGHLWMLPSVSWCWADSSLLRGFGSLTTAGHD